MDSGLRSTPPDPHSDAASVREQKLIWRTTRDWTTSWHTRRKIGRLEVGFHVHRHAYPASSHRWVFQPFFIYDRRSK